MLAFSLLFANPRRLESAELPLPLSLLPEEIIGDRFVSVQKINRDFHPAPRATDGG